MEPVPTSIQFQIRCLNGKEEEILSAAQVEAQIKPDELHAYFAKASHGISAAGLGHLRIKLVKKIDGENSLILDLAKAAFEISGLARAVPFTIIDWTVQAAPNSKAATNSTESKTLKADLFLAACILSVLNGEVEVKPRPIIGQNVFELGIYSAYLLQLKQHLQSVAERYPLLFKPDASSKMLYQHRAIQLVRHILEINVKKTALLPDAHAKILNFLRFIIKELKESGDGSPLHKEIKSFVRQLCHWMFTGPSLEEAWVPILAMLTADKNTLEFKDLLGDLREACRRISTRYDFRQAAHVSRTDFHIKGYLPSKLWTVSHEVNGQSKVSQFIRMPNGSFCLDAASFDEFDLLPELIQFAKAIELQGKTFLYINLMRTKNEDARKIVEGSMSDAIHDLEYAIKGNNVVVFSLDRNSNFYWSNDQFSDEKAPHLKVTAKFIEAFVCHLFNPDGEQPCVWSEMTGLQLADYKKNLGNLCNAVHAHYFDNCPELSPFMRTVFQELTFVEFVDQEVTINKYDYLTAACQASVDRGPSFYALLFLKQLLKQASHTNPQEIQRLITMLLINALLTENRLPYQDRIEVFLAAAEIMIKKGPMPFLPRP